MDRAEGRPHLEHTDPLINPISAQQWLQRYFLLSGFNPLWQIRQLRGKIRFRDPSIKSDSSFSMR